VRPTRAELALLVLIVVLIAFLAWARNVAVRAPAGRAASVSAASGGAASGGAASGGAASGGAAAAGMGAGRLLPSEAPDGAVFAPPPPLARGVRLVHPGARRHACCAPLGG
jgi:hypothetical protein